MRIAQKGVFMEHNTLITRPQTDDETRTFAQIVALSPAEFTDWIIRFTLPALPLSVDSVEEAAYASTLLSIYSQNLVYLTEVSARLKIEARIAQHSKKEKPAIYEDAILRRDITEEVMKALKQQYQAVSRMITVRQDNLRELNMSEYRKL